MSTTSVALATPKRHLTPKQMLHWRMKMHRVIAMKKRGSRMVRSMRLILNVKLPTSVKSMRLLGLLTRTRTSEPVQTRSNLDVTLLPR